MTNTTHQNLLDAIDDCLADDDLKVRREGRKVAHECMIDARSHLSFLRSIGVTDRARLEAAVQDIADFATRCR